MAVKPIKRPAGVSASRHVFEHQATGRHWHAEFEWRPGQAGVDSVVVIQIMEPDGTAHEGTHSHTFTEEQLADPDFDAEKALVELVGQRVERAHAIRQNKTKLGGAKARFHGA